MSNPFENADPMSDDSFPWTSDGRTTFTETGLGVLFDVDIKEKTNLMIGGRWDVSTAENKTRAGVWTIGGSGTSNANPLREITTSTYARGTDDGPSWSASISLAWLARSSWPIAWPSMPPARLCRSATAITSTMAGCAPTCSACAQAFGTTSFPSARNLAIQYLWLKATRTAARPRTRKGRRHDAFSRSGRRLPG